MKKNPKWFYIVLTIIPIMILLLLELSLRLFSYGNSYDQWVEIANDKLILNTDIAQKYFASTKNYPHSNHDVFDKVKKENSIRIFILGGSSAAGFPYSPGGAFSRYLRERYEVLYSNNKIEVVNLGITAVNTYTIADLVPGVIEQKPDLIIIYAGHNEYYGALGVGSLESAGNNAALIKAYLFLQNFRSFQLLRNIISSTANSLQTASPSAGTTLMAKMAERKSIPYNSEIFNDGIKQFKQNMEYILQEFNKNNIPVVIGTLASNLKDQFPFISAETPGYPKAEEIFNEAVKEYSNHNYKKADSLYRFAKDLDALRFRAPEKINEIIISLAEEFNNHLVNIDSGFAEASVQKITGGNLMVDHLHPTLEGYKLVGKLFSERIETEKLLPPESEKHYSQKVLDLIVKSNFTFSRLDSTIAHFTILNLLNDWPFTENKDLDLFSKIGFKDRIDSLAYKVLKENLNWEVAHQEAYKWYLGKGDAANFSEELKVLYKQYPFKTSYLTYAAQELLKLKEYNSALYFLKEKYIAERDEFSTKWLGNISLQNNDLENAVTYLNEAVQLNANDPQNYFNLSVAYLRMKSYEKALESITSCLSINSQYPNAGKMKEQLQEIIKKPL